MVEKAFVLCGENRHTLDHGFLVNVIDKRWSTEKNGYDEEEEKQEIVRCTFTKAKGNNFYVSGQPTEEGMFQLIIGLVSAWTVEYSLHIGGKRVEIMRAAIRTIVEEAMDRFSPTTQVGMDIEFPITEPAGFDEFSPLEAGMFDAGI